MSNLLFFAFGVLFIRLSLATLSKKKKKDLFHQIRLIGRDMSFLAAAFKFNEENGGFHKPVPAPTICVF